MSIECSAPKGASNSPPNYVSGVIIEEEAECSKELKYLENQSYDRTAALGNS